MIYTDSTKLAMKIAYKAHHGQSDKSGVPYILHPIHVAEQMETEEECIVALLHDVVEDSNITFEELQKYFSTNVIDAIKLLTHDDEVDYMEYIQQLKSNPIARKVKIADLKHNSDITRSSTMTEKDWERTDKYHKALEYLNE